MTKNEIKAYICTKTPTIKNLKRFSQEILDSFSRDIAYKIKIYFVVLPSATNATISVNRRKKVAVLRCNLIPVLRRDISAGMKYFQLCTSILHELEHIRTLLSANSHADSQPLATMLVYEQIKDATDSFLDKCVHALLARWSVSFSKKTHMSSSVELLCMRKSLDVAYELFADAVSEDDRTLISQMRYAISLMEKSCEIRYATASRPYYKFAVILTRLQHRVKKNPKLLNKFPPLTNLFSPAGHFLSIDELCNKASADENSFYAQIVMRLFLEGQPDVEKILCNNRGFFEQIERISNAYCQLCIDFVKNKQLCKRWFDQSFVEDNAAMMIKNYKKLEKQMAKNGMKKDAGSVIPLYFVR